MTEKHFYIVRHGDSSKVDENGNPLNDFSRPLSEKGRADIRTLAEHLIALGVKADLIMCSVFTRTRETAEIIAETLSNLQVQESTLIGEADLGNLPDTKEALIKAEYGYNTEVMLEASGEIIEEVEKRTRLFLEEILNNEHATIIVVSHGLTLSVMSQLLQGLEITFETIQVLKTGDYSYFLLYTNQLPATKFKTNVLKK